MDESAVSPDAYAHWRRTALGAATERVESRQVLELAGPLSGKRVLDVGTGDGTYALAAAAQGATVTALDVSSRMLRAAEARARDRGLAISTLEGHAGALPLGDATFDVVIAVTVLCFIPDARVAIHEMARVLAPGGVLVVGELGSINVWAALRRVRGWLGNATWRKTHFRTRGQLVRLARGAGLRVTETRGAVYFPPSDVAARVMEPWDALLTALHAPGAAFLAVAAAKPSANLPSTGTP